MAITVKEISDDAMVSIKVNKNFYLMTKALSFYLFQQIGQNSSPDDYLKDIMTKKYMELDDLQRSFYTVALLLAEMETNFKNEKMYTEKEILQPGDPGYVAPTED
jgi:hypothetical protein